MESNFSIIESTVAFQGKQFDIVRDRLRLPTGVEVQRDCVVHPGAAVFLPITAAGTFLLVRQYRHAVRRSLLECPAGTLKNKEAPLDCAAREIREEVGVAASNWVSLGSILPAPGFCSEIQHLYIARDLHDERAAADEDEFIDVVELNAAKLREAITAGELCDGKSLALLFRASLLGHLLL